MRVRIVLWLLALLVVTAFLVFGGTLLLNRFFSLFRWQSTVSG
ncbi:MAG: hypothetical protein ACYS47_03825 [Planctomycetota bacterium]